MTSRGSEQPFHLMETTLFMSRAASLESYG